MTNIRKITVENLEERIETGPLQINDDWPGTFIRGDNAAYYALMLGELLSTRKEDDYESFSSTIAWTVMKSLYGVLRSSNANRIAEHEHVNDEDVGC